MPEYSYTVRGREVRGANYTESLSHSAIPKLAAPRLTGWGEILDFLQNENLPGSFPYTAGVYPYRREEEDPTRMFAGEGAPERTNRRFHYLAAGHEATRLSTAFDSTTLVRRGPGPAARHLRPHRQFRRFDRDARRHEEAVFGLRSVCRRRPRCP